jgi:hypothetical protein
MTYTFKLARRLAVSRTLGMLPALILFAACSGSDTTAPESSPGYPLTSGLVPVTVRISPNRVTVETNQLIRFQALGHNSAGDSVGASVKWSATGGTIQPDGRFSASAPGTFMVIGRVPDHPTDLVDPRRQPYLTDLNRPKDRVDTSMVEVVLREPKLAAINVLPSAVTLTPGVAQSFFAKGTMKDGTPVPLGVVWKAEGGWIDAGGNYVAGETAGTYKVIATNTAQTVADTAEVIIDVPAPPPPPPAPTPPPAPVLASVTLTPAAATLAPSTKRQFVAYGRTTAGDSVVVDVVFTATGGTVTTGGLFTAGSSAGSFRVIASSGALADTSTVTITVPLGSGTTGIPFGSYECTASILTPFTMCIRSAGWWSAAEMTGLQAANARMILNQGGYEKFKTNGFYDSAKYYNWVQTLKPYVASWMPFLADGTLMGAQVIDDRGPENWGGKAITNEQLDEMSKWWKEIIPGIPTFVAGGYASDLPMTGHTFSYLDGSISQYNARYMGDVTAWRDKSLAAARQANTSIILSLNVLAGGKVVPGCYRITGGDPAIANSCAMTPDEIRAYGAVLAAADGACGLASWKTTASYQALPGVTEALKYVAGLAAARPATSCRVR